MTKVPDTHTSLLSSNTSLTLKTKRSIVTLSNSTNPDHSIQVVPQYVANTQSRSSLKASRKSAESATDLYEIPNIIYSKAEFILWSTKGEFFEDGMESMLSRQLSSFIKEHGSDALEALTYLLVYERVNLDVAGEALRWLGRLDHAESYQYRRWLLERCLKSSSSHVKDGALLGLASMDDKHAIPYLKAAIDNEASSELKADMVQVLEQLEG